MIQSCFLSQDHTTLLNHSETSLYLVIPEFEPQAGSLLTGFSAIRVGKIIFSFFLNSFSFRMGQFFSTLTLLE